MAILRYFFNTACFLVAFGMTVVWFCTYLKNEDSVKVDLKTFDIPEEQYPMISFCLGDPFIESALKRYNETLTGEMYAHFLSGKSFSNELNDIHFHDVTLNLADFYLGSHVKFRNGSQFHQFYDIPQVTYSAFHLGALMKCFGLRSKFTNIGLLAFSFNLSVYPDGIRPSSRPSVLVAIHLPNQISLAGSSTKSSWPKQIEKKGHTMFFNLQ